MKIVPIEGGLGAQIFGVMLFNYLKEYTSSDVLANVEYFKRAPKIARLGEGISVFKWGLDYYGINIKDYDCELPKKSSYIKRKFGIADKVKILADGTTERNEFLYKALLMNHEAVFPIGENDDMLAKKLLFRDHSATAVVHLRRGDYLNVASHLVTDLDVVKITKKLSQIGVRRILFVSDGEVPLAIYREKVPEIKEWDVLVNADIYLTHAVMRRAPCLVISNSQFSLSAAILNKDAVCFMPKKWFSGKSAVLHHHLHSLSDWHMITM